MKFNKEKRTKYNNNILYGVIFQARFPQIIKISNEEPANFQDIIRKKGFPETKIKSLSLPSGIPKSLLKGIPGDFDDEYIFLSEDEDWKVVLTKNFVALSCANYKNYEEFEEKLGTVLTVFCEEYEPAYFNRVGLRYQNIVNTEVLKDCKDIKEFIPEHIAPELKKPLGDEVSGFEKAIQFNDLHCIANVRHSMGKISGLFGKYNLNDVYSYIIDIDCFTEEKILEVNDVIKTSRGFNNDYVRNIFHWSITDKLRKAMGPI